VCHRGSGGGDASVTAVGLSLALQFYPIPKPFGNRGGWGCGSGSLR